MFLSCPQSLRHKTLSGLFSPEKGGVPEAKESDFLRFPFTTPLVAQQTTPVIHFLRHSGPRGPRSYWPCELHLWYFLSTNDPRWESYLGRCLQRINFWEQIAEVRSPQIIGLVRQSEAQIDQTVIPPQCDVMEMTQGTLKIVAYSRSEMHFSRYLFILWD